MIARQHVALKENCVWRALGDCLDQEHRNLLPYLRCPRGFSDLLLAPIPNENRDAFRGFVFGP
jgi:hypothetical protein